MNVPALSFQPAGDLPLGLALVVILCLATLTLWVPAYWPVACFEIAVFVVAAVALLQGRVPARKTCLPLAVLSFMVVWGCLQIAAGRTINRFATERSIMQWMSWAAVYYLAAAGLQQKEQARLVRSIVVWFGFALSVEAILQTYLSPGIVYGLFPSGYHDFVMGPIVYHTHFAAFMESIFPIALYRALRRSRKAFIDVAIVAMLLTSVVVSASRGGLIIVFCEAIVVIVLTYQRHPKSRRRGAYLASGLIAVTAILVSIVGFQTASSRFSSEAFTAGRIQFAAATLHMIAARPLFGWGLGSWQAVYPAFATFDPGVIVNQAHTDWLQWTAEGGVLVGIALLTLAIWSIRPAIRSIWGIGILAVLIHAGFDYPFSRPAVGAWPILILAVAAAAAGEGGDREVAIRG
jgi:hypothetical protein